ncbi:hypothetical protein [Marinobacter alexandrii]|uniref:hypothetical protein n=1 Tax=Marinobacter alexandrii TaxID=2570351 RepID=UPI003267B75A
MTSEVPPFLLAELMAPALLILAAGFVLTWVATRSVLLSLFLPLAKATVFVVYFAAFFDGTWTFLDDWTYLEKGQLLLDQGVSTTNFFAHLPLLFSTAGGKHFVYHLFNADAARLFGPAYYAPVAFNIVLTFVAAGFMAGAAKAGLHFSRRLAVGLFASLVLYPDLVAWSTVVNGKDTLVMTGTGVAVYVISQIESGRYRRAVILGVVIGFVLFFTRFYTPLMMLAAFGLAMLLSSSGRRRPWLWLLVTLGGAGVLSVLGMRGLVNAFNLLLQDFVNPIYGFFRYLLTPIPFNTTEHYDFLDLPQVLYWALMPFLVYGVYRVWRRATLTARFAVIYFLLMVALYAMFAELQGPRHRYQLDGLIVLFQFLGFLSVFRQLGMGRGSEKPTASKDYSGMASPPRMLD